MPSGTRRTHGGHGRPPPPVPGMRPRVLRARPASRRISDVIRPASAAVRTTSSRPPSTARWSAAHDASISRPAGQPAPAGTGRRIPRPCDDSGAVGASACSGGSQAGRGAGITACSRAIRQLGQRPLPLDCGGDDPPGAAAPTGQARCRPGRPRAVLSGAPGGGGPVWARRPGRPGRPAHRAPDGGRRAGGRPALSAPPRTGASVPSATSKLRLEAEQPGPERVHAPVQAACRADLDQAVPRRVADDALIWCYGLAI